MITTHQENQTIQQPAETSLNAQETNLPSVDSLNRINTKVAATILGVMILLYGYSLFANIAYPLLWADESVTAVGAERVLKYGYPKVHDGKNVLYDIKASDTTLGIDKKTDAYIGGAGWGQYYFAAPFVWLADLFSDVYLKTLLLRIPFALIGGLGLVLIVMSCTAFLKTANDKLLFASTFIIVELGCVPLLLHIREVRYYSLLIFLCSAITYLFTRHHIRNDLNYMWYTVMMVVLLICLFFSFSPAYFIFYVVVFLYLTVQYVIDYSNIEETDGNMKPFIFGAIKSSVPFFLAFIAILPLLSFFQTFHISSQMAGYDHFPVERYIGAYPATSRYEWNFAALLVYFTRMDVLLFALPGIILFLVFICKMNRDDEYKGSVKLSLFLTIYFVVYSILIGRIPNDLFVRYFINLQPVLICIMLFNTATLFSYFYKHSCTSYRIYRYAIVGFTCIGICFIYVRNNELISGHWHEIHHQYKGDLDYIIPYILNNVKSPEKLIVATNYEETSFMYYLKCKTIIGYVNTNLEEDMKNEPDILLYRRKWASNKNNEIFGQFYDRTQYAPVYFPVQDYFVNNIPEINDEILDVFVRHQFETLVAESEEEQLVIYVRKDKAATFPLPKYDGNGKLM